MPLTWSRSWERNVGSRFLICVDLDGLAEWSPSGLWSRAVSSVQRAGQESEPSWTVHLLLGTEAGQGNLREMRRRGGLHPQILGRRGLRWCPGRLERRKPEQSEEEPGGVRRFNTKRAPWTRGLGRFLGAGAQQTLVRMCRGSVVSGPYPTVTAGFTAVLC